MASTSSGSALEEILADRRLFETHFGISYAEAPLDSDESDLELEMCEDWGDDDENWSTDRFADGDNMGDFADGGYSTTHADVKTISSPSLFEVPISTHETRDGNEIDDDPYSPLTRDGLYPPPTPEESNPPPTPDPYSPPAQEESNPPPTPDPYSPPSAPPPPSVNEMIGTDWSSDLHPIRIAPFTEVPGPVHQMPHHWISSAFSGCHLSLIILRRRPTCMQSRDGEVSQMQNGTQLLPRK